MADISIFCDGGSFYVLVKSHCFWMQIYIKCWTLLLDITFWSPLRTSVPPLLIPFYPPVNIFHLGHLWNADLQIWDNCIERSKILGIHKAWNIDKFFANLFGMRGNYKIKGNFNGTINNFSIREKGIQSGWPD